MKEVINVNYCLGTSFRNKDCISYTHFFLVTENHLMTVQIRYEHFPEVDEVLDETLSIPFHRQGEAFSYNDKLVILIGNISLLLVFLSMERLYE